MTEARWLALMEKLGLPRNVEMYQKLVSLYSQQHRAYHTAGHISACLEHLDAIKHSIESPDLLELALWFHDAIYQPFSSINEQDSADLAEQFLVDNRVNSDSIQSVVDLIMVTIHNASPTSGDASIMVDIDLTILGAQPKIYAGFEAAVRREYRRVPNFIFRRNRRKLLRQFLDRNRIYQHDDFHHKLESQARENLARAIRDLS